jgi:hypothetical protein
MSKRSLDNTTGTTRGSALLTIPYHLSSPSGFSGVRVAGSLVFCAVFCRCLFVPLYFFFCPLCCMSSFDVRLLITPLVLTRSVFYVRVPLTGSVLCVRYPLTRSVFYVRFPLTGSVFCVRFPLTRSVFYVRFPLTGSVFCVRFRLTRSVFNVRFPLTWSVLYVRFPLTRSKHYVMCFLQIFLNIIL